MIILWNSAEMNISLTFVDNDTHDTVNWQADRNLARDMLSFLKKEMDSHHLRVGDIAGIGVFRGPGSYTGLRIGLTVLNTWAHSQKIPIVGSVGGDWQRECLAKLVAGTDEEIILPEYGAPARTTKPRK